MKRIRLAALSLFAFMSLIPSARAQVDAKLADAVKHAKVSLDAGLKPSEREGQPISGKFELEDGKLQLSVYTTKGGKYYEVVVDHTTGKIAKAEEITSGDDLTAAKAQAEAMAKAKRSLLDAVKAAETVNKGFHGISVTPALKDAHPIATVTVNKEHETRTATEKLD